MKGKLKSSKFKSASLDSESGHKSQKSVKKFEHGGLKGSSKRNKSISDIKNRLSGSRFRFLNEQLYSSKSEDSWNLFRNDPNLFKVYHEGYRNQVSQWPYNPASKVVSWLRAHTELKSVGDFGCGDAIIAQSLPDRKVYSFDLVSTNEFVTACNILKVPLEDKVLDASVFCLSLMGRDWPLFVLEATRCLKIGGILKIVEVTSRFSDVSSFVKFINSYGYDSKGFKYQKEELFVSFEFVLKSKVKMDKKVLLEKSKLLSPCLYKHR